MTIPRMRRKKGGSEVTAIGVAAPSYARRAIPNNPKPWKYRLNYRLDVTQKYRHTYQK